MSCVLSPNEGWKLKASSVDQRDLGSNLTFDHSSWKSQQKDTATSPPVSIVIKCEQ